MHCLTIQKKGVIQPIALDQGSDRVCAEDGPGESGRRPDDERQNDTAEPEDEEQGCEEQG